MYVNSMITEHNRLTTMASCIMSCWCVQHECSWHILSCMCVGCKSFCTGIKPIEWLHRSGGSLTCTVANIHMQLQCNSSYVYKDTRVIMYMHPCNFSYTGHSVSTSKSLHIHTTFLTHAKLPIEHLANYQ